MTQPAAKPKAGLEGVIASPSDLCFIDGNAGRLIYRGYDIGEVVEHLCFEEVCYLLWYDGELPNRAQLAKLRQELGAATIIPPHVLTILKALPKETIMMDAMRTAVSALASTDPDRDDNSVEANRRKAIRITAVLPTIVTMFHRIHEGQPILEPDTSKSMAWNFLYLLFGKPPHETIERVMDAALVLHAEHGMNASTFSARVTAATLADMHAAITSAIGALKGPLHGGANHDVMEMLLTCNTAEDAETMVRNRLKNKEKVPGFGHRVYKVFDPRATFLQKMSKQLGEAAGNTKWYDMQQRLVPIMRDTLKSDGTKLNLNPNVDFFSATAYYTMGIPLDLFTPIFGIARCVGWTAHVIQQHEHNRLLRPADEYTGVFDRKVIPIDQRK